jgi:hypothetical protein
MNLKKDCSDSDKSEEDEPEPEDDYLLTDFKLFACQRAHEDFTQVKPLKGLVDREIDRQYNWSAYIRRYGISINI